MPHLLLVGSLTRDHTVLDEGRWTQPGGAPWHAGLTLASETAITAVAQAGPWGREFGVPGLQAGGVLWAGLATERDTVFINRYRTDEREQRLLSRARSVGVDDLPAERPDGAVVSPLFPTDVNPAVATRLRELGAYVGLDVQGLLRRTDRRRRVYSASAQLGGFRAAAHALKFSLREFQTLHPAEDWRLAAAGAARAQGREIVITRGGEGALVASPAGAEEIRRGAVQGRFDRSGAGDIFLAAYVRARAGGATPFEALGDAAAATEAVLQRRARGDAAGRVAPRLRRLYAVALVAALIVEENEPERWPASTSAIADSLFAEESPLSSALAAHLSGPLRHGADIGRPGVKERGAATLSACWALLSVGWPDDTRLNREALDRAVERERRGVERLRTALSGRGAGR